MLRWMADLLELIGLNATVGGYKSLAAALVVVVCCLLVWWVLRTVLMKATKLTDKIPGKLDDLILTPNNVKKIAMGLAMILFYVLNALWKETKCSGQVLSRAEYDFQFGFRRRRNSRVPVSHVLRGQKNLSMLSRI